MISHPSLILLAVIGAIVTTANPCPCETIVNESLSNNNNNSPPISVMDASRNDFADEDILDEYFDQYPSSSSQAEISLNHLQDVVGFYPLHRHGRNLDGNRQRAKRPSWATVGKRLISKRPSWAQVG